MLLGSQRSAFNAEAVTASALSFTRKAVLVHFDEFSNALLQRIDDQNALAIIILLPVADAVSADQHQVRS